MKNHLFLLLLLLIVSCKKEQDKAQPKPIENINSKEVLLIGTFHYNNPGADVAKTKSFDILNEKSQKELQQISSRIKKYNPTKIFVEWPYNEQKELDSLYQLYLKDLYFKNDSLSDFYLKNEIFQLAFRVAKENNLETVYGVDYNETIFPYGDVMGEIEDNKQLQLKEEIENAISKFTVDFDDKIDSDASLKELTYFVNSKNMRDISNDLHNNLIPLAGSMDDFKGVFLTSEWYKRNLYMWSFVQKQTKDTDERIMVLVGSSHAAIIELFIKENINWRIKELKEIMTEN
ncbi:hypothetical protein GGR42_002101 [Saonia flava]|uniref:Uncharacterized protein n=1 Tax=Saonia flava TaxID=523696 RepID=A0A846R4A7_9FLAO|nr:DUF5694 domain-containing protein [Saonia flava]NJB71639.1 hypothetical protein [Saonia flava]